MSQPFGDPNDHGDFRRELRGPNFGTRSSFDPDWRRKEAARELGRRRQAEKETKWAAGTPGDPDDRIKSYMASAQTSSAAAEKTLHEAKVSAARYLEDFGHLLDDKQRKQFEYVVVHGYAKKEGNTFMSMLDYIDTARELVMAGFADITGLDTKAGGELTIGDYWDIYTSNLTRMT